MTYAALAVAAILLAALQVTVVPMFTVSGATADLGMIAIIVALITLGPRPAMVLTPLMALFTGFSGNRAPGLLLIGYAAIIPIGYGFDRYGIPPGHYSRILATSVLSGIWIRLVLSLGAMASGAELAPMQLLQSVLIPGIVVDAILISLTYGVLRLLGYGRMRFALQREGWLP